MSTQFNFSQEYTEVSENLRHFDIIRALRKAQKLMQLGAMTFWGLQFLEAQVPRLCCLHLLKYFVSTN